MKKLLPVLILLSLVWADEKSDLIVDLEQSLMATCCWSGTVYDHGNKEMEMEIAGMVNAGKTKTEILDYYKEKFGERVLAIPIAEGFNYFAWIAPIFIGLLGITIIFVYIRTTKETPEIAEVTDESVAYSDQIERELKEMD
ncbi:MAG: cytochrome c-type biogenesis protein CcmH [Candidatus Marinimicrobia bacterium]|nr:cytochrome c-type biogenesis protein CcmH [Candidatus Neomarinimicrobiota bacterium]MBL7009818.1 cytochrome c-type biogenesis protein CcmH [Candidatus Neomarinimicrobiota bacterium]MBL7029943.1 cytochrome c-type biogenesis protein CcmH [Candidatus Neomarinimicrobiota bacterium]